jgi:hypothetical protein
MSQQARIISAWLTHIRPDVIAHDEGLSVAEVSRIIAKASRTCRFEL